MCTSPLRIYNRRSTDSVVQLNGQDMVSPVPYRRYVDVPCGKCPECLQARRHSYFFRAFSEFHHSKGVCSFVTLTYSPENIPTSITHIPPVFNDAGDVVEDGRTITFTHWEKSHVQSFLKAVNEKLLYLSATRLGISRLIGKSVNPAYKDYTLRVGRPMRYLLVCERGKSDAYISDNGRLRFGTSRPHYHALFFLNPSITNISSSDFLDIVKEKWTYGLSYNVMVENDKSNPDCDAVSSIFYVCKYVTKQDSDTYFYDISQDPHCCDRVWKRSHLPFILISKYFGIDWLSDTPFDKILNEYLKNGVPFSVNGKFVTINIPSYYLNKIRYFFFRRDLFDGEHELSNSVPDVVFDPVSSSPVWFDGDKKQWANLYCSVPSVYFSDIERTILHNKATYICQVSWFIVENMNEVRRIWLSSFGKRLRENRWSFIPAELITLCESTSLDDIYLHVVENFGIDENDPMDKLCDMLLEFSRALTREKTATKDYLYKSKFHQWLLDHPYYFNKQPL